MGVKSVKKSNQPTNYPCWPTIGRQVRGLSARAGIYLLPIVLADHFFILILQSIAYTYMAVLGWTSWGLTARSSWVTTASSPSRLHHGALDHQLGFDFWLAFPVAIVFSAIAGLIMALTAFRAKGPYIAMVTIAFGSVVEVIANRWVSLTNGPMGLFGVSKPYFFGAKLDATGYFYLVAFVALIMTILIMNLHTSRIGRTMVALRESEGGRREPGHQRLRLEDAGLRAQRSSPASAGSSSPTRAASSIPRASASARPSCSWPPPSWAAAAPCWAPWWEP